MRSLLFILLILINFPALALDNEAKFFFFSAPETKTTKIELNAEFSPQKIKSGERISLKILGRIPTGSHIYSANYKGDGPKATSIKLLSKWLIPVGNTLESKARNKFDPAFEKLLPVHENEFWMEQEFKLAKNYKPGNYIIEGTLTYQLCEKRLCSLPIKQNFKSPVKLK